MSIEFLEKTKKRGIIGIISPDRIDFTIERLEPKLYKLTYTEHIGKQSPEIEEKLDEGLEATIEIVKQEYFVESIERIDRGIRLETIPLPPGVIMTALMGEFASMIQGVYPISKFEEAVAALQKIFGVEPTDELEEIE
ncbi:hypothetical protein ES703_53471 [subsurface metagenome]